MMINIEDFLRSGVIRGIAVGASSEDVLRQFGEPEFSSPIRRVAGSATRIWRYGALELGLIDGRVQYLGFCFSGLGPCCIPHALVELDEALNESTTIDDLESIARRGSIPFKRVRGSPDCEDLILGDRVRASFDAESSRLIEIFASDRTP